MPRVFRLHCDGKTSIMDEGLVCRAASTSASLKRYRKGCWQIKYDLFNACFLMSATGYFISVLKILPVGLLL